MKWFLPGVEINQFGCPHLRYEWCYWFLFSGDKFLHARVSNHEICGTGVLNKTE